MFHNELVRQNREEHFIPDNVIPQMFSSIKSIYQFHNDFLLPQLDKCMENWSAHTVNRWFGFFQCHGAHSSKPLVPCVRHLFDNPSVEANIVVQRFRHWTFDQAVVGSILART